MIHLLCPSANDRTLKQGHLNKMVPKKMLFLRRLFGNEARGAFVPFSAPFHLL